MARILLISLLGKVTPAECRAEPFTLTLTQAGDIGHYNLEFNAVPGKTYAFEVSPRIEPRVAIALGGFAGVLLEEAASGEHSGGFKITPVQ
jgi:hypothetical protein